MKPVKPTPRDPQDQSHVRIFGLDSDQKAKVQSLLLRLAEQWLGAAWSCKRIQPMVTYDTHVTVYTFTGLMAVLLSIHRLCASFSHHCPCASGACHAQLKLSLDCLNLVFKSTALTLGLSFLRPGISKSHSKPLAGRSALTPGRGTARQHMATCCTRWFSCHSITHFQAISAEAQLATASAGCHDVAMSGTNASLCVSTRQIVIFWSHMVSHIA